MTMRKMRKKRREGGERQHTNNNGEKLFLTCARVCVCARNAQSRITATRIAKVRTTDGRDSRGGCFAEFQIWKYSCIRASRAAETQGDGARGAPSRAFLDAGSRASTRRGRTFREVHRFVGRATDQRHADRPAEVARMCRRHVRREGVSEYLETRGCQCRQRNDCLVP